MHLRKSENALSPKAGVAAATPRIAANAHPAAKAAANEVIASNDDDAVAMVIESLLGGQE